MVQAKCIEKHKDTNGKIQEYIIVDWSGQQGKFNADELKAAIKNNQINVINLKLTRDNRLIDKDIKTLNNKNSTVISKVQKDNNDILDKPSMSSTQILNRIKEIRQLQQTGENKQYAELIHNESNWKVLMFVKPYDGKHILNNIYFEAIKTKATEFVKRHITIGVSGGIKAKSYSWEYSNSITPILIELHCSHDKDEISKEIREKLINIYRIGLKINIADNEVIDMLLKEWNKYQSMPKERQDSYSFEKIIYNDFKWMIAIEIDHRHSYRIHIFEYTQYNTRSDEFYVKVRRFNGYSHYDFYSLENIKALREWKPDTIKIEPKIHSRLKNILKTVISKGVDPKRIGYTE